MEIIKDKLANEINSCNGRLDELKFQINSIINSYSTRRHLMELNKLEKEKAKLSEKISLYKKVLSWVDKGSKD